MGDYRTTIAALFLLATLSAPAQLPNPSKPAFEVASVKPAKPGEGGPGFKLRDGRFVAERVTLRLLVAIAYRLQDSQITAGPGWVDSDLFDVEAKGETGRESADLVRRMLQALLANRFRLTLHQDTKESTIFALTVSNHGLKLKASADQTPGAALGPHGSLKVAAGSLIGTAVPLQLFASVLGQQVGRTVVNKTGLTGRFDIALRWDPDSMQAVDAEAAPSRIEFVIALGRDGPRRTTWSPIASDKGPRGRPGNRPCREATRKLTRACYPYRR
jgi:uncharacterized protein (TIGR03435 family)